MESKCVAKGGGWRENKQAQLWKCCAVCNQLMHKNAIGCECTLGDAKVDEETLLCLLSKPGVKA